MSCWRRTRGVKGAGGYSVQGPKTALFVSRHAWFVGGDKLRKGSEMYPG